MGGEEFLDRRFDHADQVHLFGGEFYLVGGDGWVGGVVEGAGHQGGTHLAGGVDFEWLVSKVVEPEEGSGEEDENEEQGGDLVSGHGEGIITLKAAIRNKISVPTESIGTRTLQRLQKVTKCYTF